MNHSFKLAPMSPVILSLTIAVGCLPVIFAFWAIFTEGLNRQMAIATVLFLLLLFAGVWLAARPSRFLITAETFTIAFPLWQRSILLGDLGEVQSLTEQTFRERFGWAMRIGVGGLWGGFGWLWTQKGGMLEFYVSRTDGLILLERRSGNPLLITPATPQEFIKALRGNQERI